jgi:hypothetical protein
MMLDGAMGDVVNNDVDVPQLATSEGTASNGASTPPEHAAAAPKTTIAHIVTTKLLIRASIGTPGQTPLLEARSGRQRR